MKKLIDCAPRHHLIQVSHGQMKKTDACTLPQITTLKSFQCNLCSGQPFKVISATAAPPALAVSQRRSESVALNLLPVTNSTKLHPLNALYFLSV